MEADAEAEGSTKEEKSLVSSLLEVISLVALSTSTFGQTHCSDSFILLVFTLYQGYQEWCWSRAEVSQACLQTGS